MIKSETIAIHVPAREPRCGPIIASSSSSRTRPVSNERSSPGSMRTRPANIGSFLAAASEKFPARGPCGIDAIDSVGLISELRSERALVAGIHAHAAGEHRLVLGGRLRKVSRARALRHRRDRLGRLDLVAPI